MIRMPNELDQRTERQLREHYEVEKKLADRLRNASKKERRMLYGYLYDELYRLVPDHIQLTQKKTPEQRHEAVKSQMNILGGLLDKNKTFLEVGAGDCALAFHVANFVKEVYAVDVSETITRGSDAPSNFKLLLSDGCSIPVPKNSIDIIYSNQLMEHIHPDDAHDQLQNIFDALAPGGVYLCITPNRLDGPHDISKYFDNVATGFHLKEYTAAELGKLFRNVGFSKIRMYVGARGKYVRIPASPSVLCESILERLPHRIRMKLTNARIIRVMISIRMLGFKQS